MTPNLILYLSYCKHSGAVSVDMQVSLMCADFISFGSTPRGGITAVVLCFEETPYCFS